MKEYNTKENELSKEDNKRKNFVITLDRKTFKYSLAIVAFASVFIWGLNHTEKPIALVSGFISVISPFIIGLCISFVINILMKTLEKIWCNIWKKSKGNLHEKFKRPIALTVSTLIFAGIIFAVMFMVVPEFIRTIETFVKNVPQYITKIETWWGGVVGFAEKFNFVLPEISLDKDNVIKTLSSLIRDNDNTIFNTTVGITTSIFSAVVNIVLAIVFSMYVLAQKEKLGDQSKKLCYAVLKREKAERFLKFLNLTNQTFSNFVTGQFTEAIIIGVLCYIGMLIFGMPYASVISVLIGVTALIPLFGAFIGTGIGAFLILFADPIKAIWFIIFIVVLQQIEGNLIYPKVVGKSVGLPGIWVLVAVTVGNKLLGVLGMLISVPISSIVYCLIKEYVKNKINENLISKQLKKTDS